MGNSNRYNILNPKELIKLEKKIEQLKSSGIKENELFANVYKYQVYSKYYHKLEFIYLNQPQWVWRSDNDPWNFSPTAK